LTFRLLFIGDVVGDAGCAAVRTLVPTLRHELGLDAIVANGENSALGGRGITSESGSDLLSVVDFLTLGNHAFDVGGAGRFLESGTRIIWPVNFNANSPGYGWGTFEAGGERIGVVNVQGRVFMKHGLRSPFRAAERAVDEVEAAGAGLDPGGWARRGHGPPSGGQSAGGGLSPRVHTLTGYRRMSCASAPYWTRVILN
jgi:calcineurin-like phosphoesterase